MFQALKNQRNLLAGAFLALMMLTLVLVGMPSREGLLVSAYLWPAAIVLTLLTVVMLCKKPSLIGFVGVGLACWFWVCTIANGDHYLRFNLRFLYGVVLTFGVALPLFLLLEGKQRERWLTALVVCIAGAAVFVALLGSYACLMDRRIALPGMEGEIGIISYRLYGFGKHPNELGCLMNLGMLSLLILVFKSNKVLVKLGCLLAMLPICFAMSLTVSRTAIAVTALILGGGCLVATTVKGGWKRWIIGVVLMGAVFAVSLYSMLTVIPKLLPSGAPVPAQTQAPAPVAGEAADAAVPEQAPVSHEERNGHIWQRSLTDGLGTFSMRTDIWKAGLEYIRQNPRTLLLGNTDGQVARIPQRLLGRPEYHMHNSYLEMLLQTGIPGLAAYLFIQLSMLWYAAKQFFSKNTPSWRKVLAAAPVAMLPCTLMEIYPAVSGHASDMMLLALTGAVIAYGRAATDTTEAERVL